MFELNSSSSDPDFAPEQWSLASRFKMEEGNVNEDHSELVQMLTQLNLDENQRVALMKIIEQIVNSELKKADKKKKSEKIGRGVRKKRVCYRCRRPGHVAAQCRNGNRRGGYGNWYFYYS